MEEIVKPAETGQRQSRTPAVYDAPRTPGRGPIDWMGGWKWGVLSLPILLGIAAIYRIYQGFTALSIGTDSSTPQFFWAYEFLVVVEVLGVGLFTVLWWGWIIRSAERLPEARGMLISAREEVRRIAVFWGLVGATSCNLYIEASFWPNQDGAWHQTLVRDTAFTPSHDPMFYLFFPLGVSLAIGTYLYGRTRLPAVYGAWKGFPWSFFLLIAATVTEVSQVAMNEWGHSVNLGNAGAEEFFSVWFHWPFVLYGWLAGGIFALWGETILRLYKIEQDVEEGQSSPASKEATAV